MTLSQLPEQRDEQFGEWNKMWLKGLSWSGGSKQPGPCDLAVPWYNLAWSWPKGMVGLLGLLVAMEKAEEQGFGQPRHDLSLAGCPWDSLLPSIFSSQRRAAVADLSLFTHASSLTVPSRCGYIHSILWVRNLRPRWTSSLPKVTQLLSGRSGI